MLKWEARDWISAIVGWACAFLALWLIPESMGPFKIALVFVTGFSSTFILRGLIPR